MSSAQEVISQWQQAVQARDYWVEQERKLRDYIVQQAFGGHTQVAPTLSDGTHYLPMGAYRLKCVATTKWEVKFGAPLAAFRDWLSQDNMLVPNHITKDAPPLKGTDVLDSVLYRRLSLRKKGFDTAHPVVKQALMPAIETKPQAPQLTLEPIK